MRGAGGAPWGTRQRPAGGGAVRPHSLIHRNNCSCPRPAWLSGQRTTSYPQVAEQVREHVWIVRSGRRAASLGRSLTEANPEGVGWLIVPVPHAVAVNLWIVGRADALAELVAGEADDAST